MPPLTLSFQLLVTKTQIETLSFSDSLQQNATQDPMPTALHPRLHHIDRPHQDKRMQAGEPISMFLMSNRDLTEQEFREWWLMNEH